MFNDMPDHSAGLLVLALLAGLVLAVMVTVEWIARRKEDALFDAFMESSELQDLERERERFWRWVHGAEAVRQQHLDESEAAAIVHYTEIHP